MSVWLSTSSIRFRLMQNLLLEVSHSYYGIGSLYAFSVLKSQQPLYFTPRELLSAAEMKMENPPIFLYPRSFLFFFCCSVRPLFSFFSFFSFPFFFSNEKKERPPTGDLIFRFNSHRLWSRLYNWPVFSIIFVFWEGSLFLALCTLIKYCCYTRACLHAME